MTVPLYLTSPERRRHDGARARQLARAERDDRDVSVPGLIPNSATNGTPAPLLQFGHGLLGDRTQARELLRLREPVELRRRRDRLDRARLERSRSTSAPSSATATRASSAPWPTGSIRASSTRFSPCEWSAASSRRTRWCSSTARAPSIRRSATTSAAARAGSWARSYMALSTDVTRGVIDNLGQPYSLLLNRSVDFDAVSWRSCKATYPNALDIQMAIALDQMLWDRSEPSGFSTNITSNLLARNAGAPGPHAGLHRRPPGDDARRRTSSRAPRAR